MNGIGNIKNAYQPTKPAKSAVTVESPSGPNRSRTGSNAPKARVKVRGLSSTDRRTLAARHLLDWRRDLLDDLGKEPSVSASRLARVEMAVRASSRGYGATQSSGGPNGNWP